MHVVAIEMFGKYRVDAAINSRNLIQRFKTTVNIEFSDFVAVFEALGDEARSLHAAVESEGSQSTSAGYRSHRRGRQAPIVGTGSGPTRRPHAPSNGPGAPGRYATRATAPSSPHPPAALPPGPAANAAPTDDRTEHQADRDAVHAERHIPREPTEYRAICRPTPERPAAPLAPSADSRRRAGRRTQPDSAPHAPSRPRAKQDLQSSRTSSPSRRSRTLPVMILTATSPSTDGVSCWSITTS